MQDLILCFRRKSLLVWCLLRLTGLIHLHLLDLLQTLLRNLQNLFSILIEVRTWIYLDRIGHSRLLNHLALKCVNFFQVLFGNLTNLLFEFTLFISFTKNTATCGRLNSLFLDFLHLFQSLLCYLKNFFSFFFQICDLLVWWTQIFLPFSFNIFLCLLFLLICLLEVRSIYRSWFQLIFQRLELFLCRFKL